MRKFRPGDHVELRHRADDAEPYSKGVILYESGENQFPCPRQHPVGSGVCWEWANVLHDVSGREPQPVINPYSTHVGECQMRLSEFGRCLREY